MVQKWGSARGDIHALQGDGVAHLPPVGVDHVGGGGHHGGLAELSPSPRGPRSRPLRPQDPRSRPGTSSAQGQSPGLPSGSSIRWGPGHPGLREGFLDGLHCLDLFFGRQHAALELEVLKAVLLVGGLGQCTMASGGQGLLMAQAGTSRSLRPALPHRADRSFCGLRYRTDSSGSAPFSRWMPSPIRAAQARPGTCPAGPAAGPRWQ